MTQLSELTKDSTPDDIFWTYWKSIEGVLPHSSEFVSLTETKNKLVRSIIEKQLIENGRFDLKAPGDACPDCRGLGERYKRQLRKVEEECRDCERDENGKPTGMFKKKCSACKGTGRFKQKHFRLTINVKCNKCDKDENGEPTGYKLVPCRTCQQTGIYKKLVPTGKLESHSICTSCKGSGVRNKKGTPVLSVNQEMAKMLKEVLVESKQE